MGGKITALRVQKRNRRRVNVYLDGRYAFSLTLIEAAKLKHGQVLSDEEIARLRQQDAVERAHERALRFLSYRPRSRAEVERYLQDKGVPPEDVAQVLERLSRVGLINDEEFARFWVSNREQFSPRSPYALRRELRQKGVPEEIIAQALAEVDEEKSAYRAAQKRYRRWAGLDYDTFRRKLGDYLVRRGFSYEVVRSVVERIWRENSGSQDNNG